MVDLEEITNWAEEIVRDARADEWTDSDILYLTRKIRREIMAGH